MAQVLAIDSALSLKQFESPARDGVIQVFHSFKTSFDLGAFMGGREGAGCVAVADFSGIGELLSFTLSGFQGYSLTRMRQRSSKSP